MFSKYGSFPIKHVKVTARLLRDCQSWINSKVFLHINSLISVQVIECSVGRLINDRHRLQGRRVSKTLEDSGVRSGGSGDGESLNQTKESSSPTGFWEQLSRQDLENWLMDHFFSVFFFALMYWLPTLLIFFFFMAIIWCLTCNFFLRYRVILVKTICRRLDVSVY